MLFFSSEPGMAATLKWRGDVIRQSGRNDGTFFFQVQDGG
ncbi:Uncharacterized protein EbC_36870 [Erwinia billingiae Eb661]|jgi:hypothetical protein|uniref:Uncharacterized protein n=1 Tax=Erwinia billingiae (strain Eb661) TaxID=634500 RepID=D8MWL1_ERWBE|nr:Uncharacterized protein EbC_36870 [Erwinia billingiae Eb661]